MLESTVIKELLEQKVLLFYSRYVDDCLLLVRKRAKNNILNKMNSFDSFLKFSVEEMKNGELIYLDTKIIELNGKLELKQYRKTDNESTCMMNYRKAVAPLQYKNSCLNGEIYRAYHCTSNVENLNLALENLEEIFVLNQYPRKLVKNKINEIKARNFGPNPNKELRLADENDPEITFFYLSIPYTSFRCSKIATNIIQILAKYTKNYRVKICFKTITLEGTILPRLKPFKPLLLTPNTVYLFTCVCSETYIGHTSRLLKIRIQEHNRCENSHIYEHIFGCVKYHESLEVKHGTAPSLTQLRNHLYDHFTALSTNLPNWHERTAFEGLMITQLQPTLNKQLKYKKSNLICICISRINDPFEQIE